MLMRQIPDEVVLAVAERFLAGETVALTTEWLKTQIPEATREYIYPILREAVRRGFLEFRSPLDHGRQARIRAKYPQAPAELAVVKTIGPNVIDDMAHYAAEAILHRIKELKTSPVHIGFGGGNTVKLVARHLSDLLRHEFEIKALAFHALGNGFAGNDPSTSAASFFGFFHDVEDHIKIAYHLLMAAPFVPCYEYKNLRTRRDISDCFKLAEEMDIVVTTLNSANHKHGLLECFMQLAGEPHRKQLKAAGWVGDVLWRPYSRTGPIVQDTGIRAVTVLELHNLVDLVTVKNKDVFMVAGPCPTCNEDKSDALRPLLTEPSLRLCNHLIVDLKTAEHLLR